MTGDITASRARLIVFALWAVLVAAPLSVREVMPPDEPRFTQVASEMRDGLLADGPGRLVVPTLGGRVYGDKPPVLFWSILAASLPAGRVTETTARIPSALASLAVLLLTLRLGRRLYGTFSAGLGGCLVLMTTAEFFQRSGWVSTDMLLTALVLAAAVCWCEAIFGAGGAGGRAPDPETAGPGGSIAGHGAPGAEPSPPRERLLLIGWLALSAALLTKGPVALLWSFSLPIAEGLMRGRLRAVAGILRSAGLPVTLAITGSWLAGAEWISGGGFIREVLLHQTVERYVSAWNSQAPWYFYLYRFPLDLAPWFLLLPALVAVVLTGARRHSPAGTRALALALGAGLVFFSTSTGKRGVYLLPGFPMAALLLARGFVLAGTEGGAVGALRTVPLLLFAVLGLLLVVAPSAPVLLDLPPTLSSTAVLLGVAGLAAVSISGLALLVGSLAGLRLSRRGRTQSALMSVSIGLVPLFFTAAVFGGSAATRHQGAAAFGAEIARRVPAQESLAVERGKFELILYYSGRRGFEFEKDRTLLEALDEGKVRYAIVEEGSLPALQARGGDGAFGGLHILYRGRISDTTFLLLGPPGPGSEGVPPL